MDFAIIDRVILIFFLPTVLLLGFGVIAVSPATAAEEGKVAFDSAGEIFVMGPDGTDQTRLTFNSAADYYPSLSSDGSRIAFESNRDGNYEIYVMNSDGTDQTRLTVNSIEDGYPTWSPDGSRIAFESYRDGNFDIYVMNADGSGQTRLTTAALYDGRPEWSPDGTRITFDSTRDGGNSEIYVMNSDGTGQTRLTSNDYSDSETAWTPDSSKIAFGSNRGSGWQIYIMNANGSGGQNPLTVNGGATPTWSPDGSRIAFTSWRNSNYDIYVINVDGSGETRLTFGATVDESPSWGGKAIAHTTTPTPSTSTPTPTPTPTATVTTISPTPTATPLPSAGMTITRPGFYSLDGNRDYGGWDIGILIASSDVVLDGMGYSVEGFNKAGSMGISVKGNSNAVLHNITIRNISARYWGDGIDVVDTRDFTIQNVLSEWNTNGACISNIYSNRGMVRASTFRNNLMGGVCLDYTGLITVDNCSIYSNRDGISLMEAGKDSTGDGPVLLTNNEIINNRQTGIDCDTSGLIVTNNTIRENGGDGIIVDRSSPNIERNRIQNNVGSAIRSTYKASDSRIVSNWITGNGYGIFVGSWEHYSENEIWNNVLNNTDNGNYHADEWTPQVLNTTKIAGENIVGGPYIGGNFWAYPNGTGYSQTCTDADHDGICDAPYVAPGGRTDYYPLAVPPAAPPKPLLLVPGGTHLPTDNNNDGKYDDVNGNGRADFADVVLYFNQMSWISVNEPLSLFDYNGNGRIDFADVVWLFNHI